ncbi:MAG TPA: hypothetical protein VH539_24910 [Gemmatimonadaceae bacterium]
MRVHCFLSMLAVVCLVPSVASAQQKKVTCADNTIVTSKSACSKHGGVQKPGGLNKAGKEINKAAIDVKEGTEKGAKKVGHGVHEAAGDVSKGAQKAVHPRTYKANCNDGTKWTGHSKSDACKKHGGVANWP